MDKIVFLLIAVAIFIVFLFLFNKIVAVNAKKEYSKKEWKHWPTRLNYWQAAILYSTSFTVVTVFLLKWTNILSF